MNMFKRQAQSPHDSISQLCTLCPVIDCMNSWKQLDQAVIVNNHMHSWPSTITELDYSGLDWWTGLMDWADGLD